MRGRGREGLPRVGRVIDGLDWGVRERCMVYLVSVPLLKYHEILVVSICRLPYLV